MNHLKDIHSFIKEKIKGHKIEIESLKHIPNSKSSIHMHMHIIDNLNHVSNYVMSKIDIVNADESNSSYVGENFLNYSVAFSEWIRLMDTFNIRYNELVTAVDHYKAHKDIELALGAITVYSKEVNEDYKHSMYIIFKRLIDELKG